MKLLLCKNVDKLGIVGDVVDVPAGYARNYLLPHDLATEPTTGNMRRLANARRMAEKELAERHERLGQLAESLKGVEVTIRAKANEDGVLYGSVGAREISAALEEENHFVKADQIVLAHPIRHLDNVTVEVRLSDDLRSAIKVWVVREKVEGESEKDGEPGMEAEGHGDGTID